MRRAELPIDVLIQYYSLVQQGESTMEARKAILVEHQAEVISRMKELKQTLDLLDYKINYYDQAVLKVENAIVE